MTNPAIAADQGAISIIVPCYNQARFLKECLDSIIAQTLPPKEIIVVDDRSPDSEQISDIVTSMNDSRISLVKHEVNRGLGASRNTGTRLSSGQFLLFVDADDMLYPTFCERLMACFIQAPDLDLAFSAFQLFGMFSTIGFLDNAELQPWEVQLKMDIPGPGVLMRRSVWERVGGYCEDPLLKIAMEDRDFWIATIPLGLKIAHLSDPLYRWRRHSESLSMPTRLEKPRYKLSRFIVQRHGEIFHANNVAGPFLAHAYFSSAKAYSKEGQRLKALWLSTIGLLYSRSEYQHRLQWLELIHPAIPSLWQRLKASLSRS